MSASNGDEVIRIEKKGIKKFAFGDGPVFSVDVIRAMDAWNGIDGEYRDAAGGVPKEKLAAWRRAQLNFARDWVTATVDPQVAAQIVPEIDDAQALAFINRLDAYIDGLKDFFGVRTGKEPSPPPPSDSATVFTE